MLFEVNKRYNILWSPDMVVKSKGFSGKCVKFVPKGYTYSEEEYEKFHCGPFKKGMPNMTTTDNVFIFEKDNGGYVVLPEKGAKFIASVEVL